MQIEPTPDGEYTATIHTNRGNIIALNAGIAPKTVNNFGISWRRMAFMMASPSIV